MAQKTPEQIAEKYGRGIAGAGEDYRAGIQNPSRSWAQAAQAAEGRWRTGIQEAIQKRSFGRGVQRAGDSKWQTNALEKGADNYVGAAPRAAQAYAQVAGQVMAAASQARGAAQGMPGDTQEQRIQRAVAAMRATSQYWSGRRTGG